MTTDFVCHVEWGTSDPAGLSRFMANLFGWQFQEFAPDYLMYLPENGGISVGINRSGQMKSGGSPNVSVRVKDIDAALRKAQELGGNVAVPKVQMGTGSFAFISAPDGNLIGLQQV